jgi:hypothetical protein
MLPRLNIAWAEQFVILPDTVRGYMAQPWYKKCAFGCFGRQSAPPSSIQLDAYYEDATPIKRVHQAEFLLLGLR